ncbi:MAG: hypothetical protein WKF91_03930 [Segetibacter sp.]
MLPDLIVSNINNEATVLRNDVKDNKNTSDKQVALYFYNPMQAHGCSGHPNVEDHAILADELVPFFRKLLL